MIVSEKNSYINIGIPKTATVSVLNWLIARHAGRSIREHHDWKVPRAFRKYLIFTVVRNPYARCYSLWKWERHTGERGGIEINEQCSFEDFLNKLIELQESSPNIYMNQSEYIKRANVGHIILFESIKDGLEQLPFVGSASRLPHLNKKSGIKEPFENYYTKNEEALVWQYCSQDFVNFGYKRMEI